MIQTKSPHQKSKEVSPEIVMRVNQAYWESNLSQSQVRETLGVSNPIIDRILFHRRDEWFEYKRKHNTQALTQSV